MADETEKPEGAEPATPAAPAAAPAPPQKSREEILRDPMLAGVAAQFGDAITAAREFAGETTLTVQRDRVREVCEAFKKEGFDYLVDLTGVDYSKFAGYTGERFAVVYQLYSFSKNKRLRLKASAPDGAPVPSVSAVWKTANWHERETFDMFGIRFTDHPSLERILMWEGFNGHPLRKDFPVRGIDTGARIYPEIFPAGGGPKPGSTGKDAKDVNLWKGEWNDYGRAPISPPPPPPAAKPAIAPATVGASPRPPLPASGGGEGETGEGGEQSATAQAAPARAGAAGAEATPATTAATPAPSTTATPEPVPSTPPTPAPPPDTPAPTTPAPTTPAPTTPAPTTPAPTTPAPTTPTPTKPAPTPPPSPGTPAPTPSTPATPDPTTPTTPAPTAPPVVTSPAAKTAKPPASAVMPSTPTPVVPSEGEEEEREEGEEEPDA